MSLLNRILRRSAGPAAEGVGGATRTGPRITGEGGRVIRQGGDDAASAAAKTGNNLGGVGTGVSSIAAFELAQYLLGALGKGASKAIDSTSTPVPVGGMGTANRYTLPMDSPLAYTQYYNQEMYNRALLKKYFGIDLGADTMPERPLTQTEAFNLNQIAMQRTGLREQELARIQGELASLPAAFQSQGRVADAASNTLQQAIATVLQRAPVEKSEALKSIATVNQFSN